MRQSREIVISPIIMETSSSIVLLTDSPEIDVMEIFTFFDN